MIPLRIKLISIVIFLGLTNLIFAQPAPGIIDSIYTRLALSYVEKPDLNRLFRSGMDASLITLDPYTNYFNEEEAQDFRFSLQSRYGGIGCVINTMNDSIFVKEVFKGYPADESGVKPGDIILEIDTVNLKGMAFDDVFFLLRGVPGSEVRCKVFRPSSKHTFEIRATREIVMLPSVPYFGLLPGNLGYIKLTSETEQTSQEVRSALMELKKFNLKGLVLDLRGNIGGLMNQGISVANLFIEKGKVAVSEKSWYADTTNYFMNEPVDTQIPLVVLVNDQTVSSGEIIAGALQDHDRAILIGQKTFGKGMVQKLFDLHDGGMLKVTTAYYYTPSSRCIQRREKGGERTVHWTDTLKKTVYTAGGRPLISFDGITPDIVMERIPEPPVVWNLLDWNNTHLFRYANRYFTSHSGISNAATFRVTDKVYDDFISFLKEENFLLTSQSESKLDELQKTLEAENYQKGLVSDISTLREHLIQEKEKQYSVFKKQIKNLLEGEIVSQYLYEGGRVENSLKDDEELKKAIEVLSNWGKYKKILNL